MLLTNADVKNGWLPAMTKRQRRVANVVAPFMWVLFACGAYVTFTKGRVGEGIGHIGMLIVLFAAMIGPNMWAIVTENDVALRKVLSIVIVFGILTTATGWLIRFAT